MPKTEIDLAHVSGRVFYGSSTPELLSAILRWYHETTDYERYGLTLHSITFGSEELDREEPEHATVFFEVFSQAERETILKQSVTLLG